jgi:hypothetical protein
MKLKNWNFVVHVVASARVKGRGPGCSTPLRIEILSTFFRHDNTNVCTSFTLQPKSATEIGLRPEHWNFEK